MYLKLGYSGNIWTLAAATTRAFSGNMSQVKTRPLSEV